LVLAPVVAATGLADEQPPIDPLGNLEYHVLLALADRALYGYAIKEAVAAESGGVLQPRAGSL
jgi:DNA-binding PadR family transcriptional regulator